MSVASETQKKPKTLSPEAIERKKISDQIKSHKDSIKALEEKQKALKPVRQPKKKVVITDTMRLAETVGKSLKETKEVDGKKVPKMVASKSEFRSKCARIVGLNDLEKDLTRGQVDLVVREGLALLETMPKPVKAKK